MSDSSSEQKILILVNPISGQKLGQHICNNDLIPKLKEANFKYEVKITDSKGQAELITSNSKQFNSKNHKVLVIISGDGTIHECINGMLKNLDEGVRNGLVPILTLPGGSSNSTANSLFYSEKGVRPKNNQVLTDWLLSRLVGNDLIYPSLAKLKFSDLYSANSNNQNPNSSYDNENQSENDSGIISRSSSSSANSSSGSSSQSQHFTQRYTNLITCSGIMANVSARAQIHRGIHPTIRGVYAAVRELLKHQSLGKVNFEYTDLNDEKKTISGTFMLVAVCVGPNVSSEIKLMPEAKMCDKTLHIFILKKKNRLRTIISFIRAMNGSHLDGVKAGEFNDNDAIMSIKAKSIKVTKFGDEDGTSTNSTESVCCPSPSSNNTSSNQNVNLSFSENPESPNLEAQKSNTTCSSRSSSSSSKRLKEKVTNFCIDGEISQMNPSYSYEMSIDDKSIPFFG